MPDQPVSSSRLRGNAPAALAALDELAAELGTTPHTLTQYALIESGYSKPRQRSYHTKLPPTGTAEWEEIADRVAEIQSTTHQQLRYLCNRRAQLRRFGIPC